LERPSAAAPSLTGAPQAPPGILLDNHVRNDVLNSLAQALESRYVLPDMAKKIAAAVRAKQKAHAYEKVLTAPELARVLTDDLLSVAHDKHPRVTFSRIPMPASPAGSLSPQMLDELRRENGAIAKVEILEGNVRYMRVNGVPPVEAALSNRSSVCFPAQH
jgi:hypothetical protein